MEKKYIEWVFKTYGTPDMCFVKFDFRAFYSLLRKMLVDMICIFHKNKCLINDSEVWVVSNTLNNDLSSDYLNLYIEDIKFYKIERGFVKSPINIGFNFKAIIELCFFLIHTDVKWYKYNPHLLYDVFNFNYTLKNLFLLNKPRAIVFLNDHYYLNRMLLNAAKQAGINTIYIAHASVSKFFPQLEFNHSFLFGKHMLETYKGIGIIHGNTYLFGNPRLDDFIELRNLKRKRNVIGIGVNYLDDFKLVELTIKNILSRFQDVYIKVRFHPACKVVKIFDFERVEVTFAKTDSLKSFLEKISVLICGNSGLVLDGAVSGVKCIQFPHEIQPMEDNYDFIKNGIAVYCSNYDELFEALFNNESSEFLQKTAYYEASIGSKHEGGVKKKIAMKISDILHE